MDLKMKALSLSVDQTQDRDSNEEHKEKLPPFKKKHKPYRPRRKKEISRNHNKKNKKKPQKSKNKKSTTIKYARGSTSMSFEKGSLGIANLSIVKRRKKQKKNPLQVRPKIPYRTIKCKKHHRDLKVVSGKSLHKGYCDIHFERHSGCRVECNCGFKLDSFEKLKLHYDYGNHLVLTESEMREREAEKVQRETTLHQELMKYIMNDETDSSDDETDDETEEENDDDDSDDDEEIDPNDIYDEDEDELDDAGTGDAIRMNDW